MTSPPVVPPSPDAFNPYAPPKSNLSVDAVQPVFDLTREEVESFVGPKHLYYWKMWQRVGAAGGTKAGFNGAAFFFNLFWLLYRKMVREFFIGFGGLVAVSVALAVLSSATGHDLSQLDRVIQIVVGVAVGMLGNSLYLRRARRAIAAARAEEPDLARRRLLLAQRGGTSFLLAMVGTVASVALAALAQFAAH